MWTNFLRRLSLNLQLFWKDYSPQTLLGRSMLILVLPVILTLGIGLFVFFDRHWSTTTNRLINSLAGDISFVVDMWEQEPNIERRQRLLNMTYDKLGMETQFFFAQTIPETRRLSVPGINHVLEKALQHRLHRPSSITSITKNGNAVVLINVAVKDGLLEFHVPQKYLFSTTTYVFLLFMVGSGLILSVIAVVFMRNQIRPVRKLALAAEQFGKGVDVERFRPSGAREVRQAAKAFLDMRDRIQRQIRQRTDMLSGVSHDLRTPLTRMKLQLAMLPKNADTEAMQNDLVVMEKMVNGYLDFAKGEIFETSLSCNIIDLLEKTIENARRQGHEVKNEMGDTQLYMTVRPQSLLRVFGNILENARLYASKSWVSVNLLPRSVEVIFDDDGPGIPSASREDVFKPFHRLDESRNQTIEGTGLGLTIARDMVQSHGGTISLDTAPQGGLRVLIWLPL